MPRARERRPHAPAASQPPALHRIAGPLSTVEVYADGEYLAMRFAGDGGLVQGRMHSRRPLDFGGRYHAAVCAAALAVEAPRRALCLGLGVGALPRLLRAMWPGLAVDVVEIDPAVIAAAERYFGLRSGDGLSVIPADAAEFVRRPPPGPAYDAILLDCYDACRIPAALTTADFVRGLLALAAPGGVVVANVVTSRAGAGALLGHLGPRLCGAMVIPVPGASNRVWFGGRSGLPDLRAMRRRAALVGRRVPLDLPGALSIARPVGR